VKSSDNKKSGEWTMVYDEGFEIKLGSMKYFAFSKYEPKGREGVSLCD
jgi:cathepsin C